MKLTKKIKELVPLYTYKIEWDADDKIFVVTVEELSGCMSHGDTQEEALKMGHEAVEGYLETLHGNEMEIPEPFSLQSFKGEFMVRATPALHKKLVVESKRAGSKSFNKYVVATLETAVSSQTK